MLPHNPFIPTTNMQLFYLFVEASKLNGIFQFRNVCAELKYI